jgi:hypothetical protein
MNEVAVLSIVRFPCGRLQALLTFLLFGCSRLSKSARCSQNVFLLYRYIRLFDENQKCNEVKSESDR